jgi:hypothetical protein
VTSRFRKKWDLGIMIRAKALTADPSFTQYVDVGEDPGSWGKVKRDAMCRITVEDGTNRRAVRMRWAGSQWKMELTDER